MNSTSSTSMYDTIDDVREMNFTPPVQVMSYNMNNNALYS